MCRNLWPKPRSCYLSRYATCLWQTGGCWNCAHSPRAEWLTLPHPRAQEPPSSWVLSPDQPADGFSICAWMLDVVALLDVVERHRHAEVLQWPGECSSAPVVPCLRTVACCGFWQAKPPWARTGSGHQQLSCAAVLELRPHVLVRSGPARIGCFASRRAARDQADVAEHRQPARSGACSDGSEQTPAWKMDCSVTGGRLVLRQTCSCRIGV